MLHQLADNAPSTFSSRNREFFESIWGPLRDPKEQLRTVAVKAMSACLLVMRQREQRLEGYFTVHDQIMIGLLGRGSGGGSGSLSVTAEGVHGSLIVVGEMLKHTGDFMTPR